MALRVVGVMELMLSRRMGYPWSVVGESGRWESFPMLELLLLRVMHLTKKISNRIPDDGFPFFIFHHHTVTIFLTFHLHLMGRSWRARLPISTFLVLRKLPLTLLHGHERRRKVPDSPFLGMRGMGGDGGTR